MVLLLHPSVVALIDLFRASSTPDFSHNSALSEDVEQRLGTWSNPTLARAIVTEALVLGVALSRERPEALVCRASGERLASRDESRLIGLISASWAREPEIAVPQATASLNVPREGLAAAAAHRLALHIGQAGLPWPAFEAVQDLLVTEAGVVEEEKLAVDADAAFRFNS